MPYDPIRIKLERGLSVAPREKGAGMTEQDRAERVALERVAELRQRREARGDADPLSRLRARTAERIASGEAEPVVEVPTAATLEAAGVPEFPGEGV